jgi:hypothetical protein
MTETADSFALQERDLILLRGLFECRLMTAAHVAALYFDGKKEAAKKRLQKLKAAGLLRERTRKVYAPAVLFLAPKALALLRTNGVLTDYPRLEQSSLEKRAYVSDLTLRHELEVMDVKAAFHSAITKVESFSIAEFSTWPRLHEFRSRRYGSGEVTVKPDGFIRLREQESEGVLSEHTFFLELDRSTETQDTLVNRAACYLHYYQSGNFAVKNRAARTAYKDYPFRVLMVFKNSERRNNTAEKLLQSESPIFTHAWLSTFDEVATNPFGAIWIRPIDYRDATVGTVYDTAHRRASLGYRRQTDRESMVEKKIKKLPLLEKNSV